MFSVFKLSRGNTQLENIRDIIFGNKTGIYVEATAQVSIVLVIKRGLASETVNYDTKSSQVFKNFVNSTEKHVFESLGPQLY